MEKYISNFCLHFCILLLKSDIILLYMIKVSAMKSKSLNIPTLSIKHILLVQILLKASMTLPFFCDNCHYIRILHNQLKQLVFVCMISSKFITRHKYINSLRSSKTKLKGCLEKVL